MAKNRNILKPGREGIVKAKPEQLPQKGIRADVLPILEELDKLAKQHRGTAAGAAFLVAEGIVYEHRVPNQCAGCVYAGGIAERYSSRVMAICTRCRRYEGMKDRYLGRSDHKYRRSRTMYQPEKPELAEKEIYKIMRAAERRRKEDSRAKTART